jgi:hypothetical protein
LEANAAMKSIVRKDTGEDWTAYVVRLMREAGVVGPDETPSKEEVIRFDRKRKDKTTSNLKGSVRLNRLGLARTKVTAKGVEALKQELPKCQIAWDPPTKK